MLRHHYIECILNEHHLDTKTYRKTTEEEALSTLESLRNTTKLPSKRIQGYPYHTGIQLPTPSLSKNKCANTTILRVTKNT